MEVKSVPHNGWGLEQRVSQKQMNRILRVHTDLSHKCSAVRFHLALVSSDGGVQVVEDFLCDLL